mmetsp:Transcript_26438/g.44145  ORF Transcript_26438/g.44145 Transcript_26438/m.44145 type:complete len:445 (-) Transcript_26438:301-1635(-)
MNWLLGWWWWNKVSILISLDDGLVYHDHISWLLLLLLLHVLRHLVVLLMMLLLMMMLLFMLFIIVHHYNDFIIIFMVLLLVVLMIIITMIIGSSSSSRMFFIFCLNSRCHSCLGRRHGCIFQILMTNVSCVTVGSSRIVRIIVRIDRIIVRIMTVFQIFLGRTALHGPNKSNAIQLFQSIGSQETVFALFQQFELFSLFGHPFAQCLVGRVMLRNDRGILLFLKFHQFRKSCIPGGPIPDLPDELNIIQQSLPILGHGRWFATFEVFQLPPLIGDPMTEIGDIDKGPGNHAMRMVLAEFFQMFVIAKPMFIPTGIPRKLQMIEHFDLIGREITFGGCFLINFKFLALRHHPIGQRFVFVVLGFGPQITMNGLVKHELEEHGIPHGVAADGCAASIHDMTIVVDVAVVDVLDGVHERLLHININNRSRRRRRGSWCSIGVVVING